MGREIRMVSPGRGRKATWSQVWETVSEKGTPVSPAFATEDELIAYLAEHGDWWDQNSGEGGWGMESATRFVRAGWAPTMIVQNGIATEGKKAV